MRSLHVKMLLLKDGGVFLSILMFDWCFCLVAGVWLCAARFELLGSYLLCLLVVVLIGGVGQAQSDGALNLEFVDCACSTR